VPSTAGIRPRTQTNPKALARKRTVGVDDVVPVMREDSAETRNRDCSAELDGADETAEGVPVSGSD